MTAYDNNEFKKYQTEAEEKWGKTEAYQEYSEKTKNYSDNKMQGLANETDTIFAEFAECMKSHTPDSNKAQDLVKALQDHITENYYHCTSEILSGLGQMYVYDERFRNNINKHTDGTAEFVNKAIHIYCGK